MNERSVLQNPATRDHFIVYVGLFLLLLISWAYMGYMVWAMQNMDVINMWMPPRANTRAWQPYDFFMLFIMWVIMMIAMMTPSVTPMISLYITVSHKKRQQAKAYVPTYIFLLGYLLAWIAFSIGISIVQFYLHVSGLLNPMMDSRSYLLSGGILVFAGIYQWTPAKGFSLNLCRTPLQFLMTRWQEGKWGAIRMGWLHGIYCVACCWALMAVMIAIGVMNMLWMIIIAFFVIAEKISPFSASMFRILSGLAMVVWGGYWLSLYPW